MNSSSTEWTSKALALLFALFCLELGIFLVVFPWTEYWEHNYFSWISPDSPERLPLAQWWYATWQSPALRGAVSGLGAVNLLIGLQAVMRLLRFAAPPAAVTGIDGPHVPLE
ncbi:MAG: hypothetical protein FJW31_30095 [Acidobacteria bacterium]|nr:hypothetical protein [Acidobacteriota bacterium]